MGSAVSAACMHCKSWGVELNNYPTLIIVCRHVLTGRGPFIACSVQETRAAGSACGGVAAEWWGAQKQFLILIASLNNYVEHQRCPKDGYKIWQRIHTEAYQKVWHVFSVRVCDCDCVHDLNSRYIFRMLHRDRYKSIRKWICLLLPFILPGSWSFCYVDHVYAFSSFALL